jgi:hypothetical protein
MIYHSDTLALVVDQESSVYELELSMITITKAELFKNHTFNIGVEIIDEFLYPAQNNIFVSG